MSKENTRASDQALVTYDNIKEMLNNMNNAKTSEEEENARTAIDESPLSVNIINSYEILISWGGPATRIVGELEDGEPTTAKLQHQDWATPWTDCENTDEDILLEYARQFYFAD